MEAKSTGTKENHYDAVVIGSGPGGYQCAIRLAQLGVKTICVEKGDIGGTCLNVGCIPSKYLLNISHQHDMINSISKGSIRGLSCSASTADITKIIKNKSDTVAAFRKGISSLFKKNKVDFMQGEACFEDRNRVKVKYKNKHDIITADNIVIATGSEPLTLPSIKPDHKSVITSDEAVSLSKAPKDMIIVGGGVIGLELASVWQRFGTKVTVVEFTDKLIPGADAQISTQMQKILTKQGISFLMQHKVLSVSINANKVKAEIQDIANNTTVHHEAEKLLIAIGRKAYTDKLELEKVNVAKDDRGRIIVDTNFKTSTANIFAIGDVIAGPMLAHKAGEDAMAVAEMIAGTKPIAVNYNLIPSVVYTNPEMASIGMTEEQLKERGIPYKVGNFPFIANSRAKASGETEGFVKMLAHKTNDTILGVHIICAQAGSLIGEMSVAMAYGASSEDIALICHSHPDFSEAMKEAAMSIYFKAINM